MVFPTWLHAGDAGQEPIAISDAEYFFYIAGDHLGSASILTEGMKSGKHMGLTYKKGQLLQKYEYQPFGQESHVLNPNLWMDPRFTDQSLDLETGLYYYKARYYNPKLKRFIQPDTMVPDPTDLQSWNRYSYVKNNPLKYVDPSGHAEFPGSPSDDYTAADYNDDKKEADAAVAAASTVTATTNAANNNGTGAVEKPKSNDPTRPNTFSTEGEFKDYYKKEGEAVVVTGTKPLKGLGGLTIPRSAEDSFLDRTNTEVLHEHLFFIKDDKVTNLGFSNKGIEIDEDFPGNITDYQFSDKVYKGVTEEQVRRMYKDQYPYRPKDYQPLGNNCQCFVEDVLND